MPAAHATHVPHAVPVLERVEKHGAIDVDVSTDPIFPRMIRKLPRMLGRQHRFIHLGCLLDAASNSLPAMNQEVINEQLRRIANLLRVAAKDSAAPSNVHHGATNRQEPS